MKFQTPEYIQKIWFSDLVKLVEIVYIRFTLIPYKDDGKTTAYLITNIQLHHVTHYDLKYGHF